MSNLVLPSLGAALLVACGSGGGPGGRRAAASVGAAGAAVIWTVDEGTSGGAATAGGLYTAPASAGTFHVRATSAAAPAVSAAATVSVIAAPAGAPARIYPTIAGGREWSLPDDADLGADPEFHLEDGTISIVQSGSPTVYHTDGEAPNAQIRMEVSSPAGKAWWRNVEMTGYYRWLAQVGSGQEPHWEMEVRGERHLDQATVVKGTVDHGVAPPAGTITWPWWSAFTPDQSIIAAALGTAYHGNVYATTHNVDLALFEKELSHTQGYAADQRGKVSPPGMPPAQGTWFGYKFIARNSVAGDKVKLELWVDEAADGTWVKVTEYVDENGLGHDWTATADDGTNVAPYGIALNQLITWAGPYVDFRADCVSIDFKQLSVREIAPY
jgi:hypothetical protein